MRGRGRGPGCLIALAVMVLGGVAVWGGGADRARAQMPDPAPTPTTVPTRTPPPVPPPTPVQLARMEVAVTIDGGLAVTTADLAFVNPTDRPQEATLLFPVPSDAAVSDFTLTVGGRTLEGELLGRDEAARIYAEIVRQARDPALLEYVGMGVLRARVFPVPPHDQAVLTVRYAQLLVPENGTLRYRLPLGVAGDAAQRLARLTIAARVSAAGGVRSLFSPTHDVRVTRESEGVMAAAYEETDALPRGTFELDALPAGDAVGAGIIAYRAGGDDGFFMLWLAPALREEAVVEKDVLLVLDVSGSMQGRKLEQAKAALRFVLERLGAGDRFNVIAFSSSVQSFADGPRPAAEADAARAYVDRLRAEGGTNINDALLTALRAADPGRLTTVLFLTDGEPTVGEQNPDRILENVRAAAPPNVRLFVFGVGDDVNTLVLDGLAVQNHGDVVYVRPSEDVEAAVSTLYARVSAPQLTSVRLEMSGASVYDVYPQPLPDLFGGQTLFVTGRYRAATVTTVRLTGMTRAGEQTFTFEGMALPTDDRRAAYLPRLWAQRKVGALLREIRLRGPERNRELIDEVIALGTRYGIVTPYTSFLVQEPGAGGPRPPATPVPRAPVTGATAVSDAAGAGALAAATPAPARTPPAPLATPVPGAVPAIAPAPAPEIRTVGDRAFVLRNGVWTDTQYRPGTATVKVAFGSDAYFALLAEKPELAPYFALGERAIVVLDGVAYEVTP
jgi:Ca-activated chloride channel family protein